MILKRMLNTISFISVVSAILLILLVIYWLIYPYKTVKFSYPKFPVLNKNRTIKRGDNLFYQVDYCKYVDLPSLVTKAFSNDIVFFVPETTGNSPTGCHSVNIQMQVPADLPMGDFHVMLTYTYQVNPIRSVTVRQETEEFKVVESTQSAVEPLP